MRGGWDYGRRSFARGVGLRGGDGDWGVIIVGVGFRAPLRGTFASRLTGWDFAMPSTTDRGSIRWLWPFGGWTL